MLPLRLVPAALAGLVLAAGVAFTASPAQAACASVTSRSVSGTVTGQDGRDVNASVGFDVVDAHGQPINADPNGPGYGCPKTGGYSIPQRELNHFVSGQGVPAGTLQPDGTRTVRAIRIGSLPANAAQVWIEVYSRGYTGSPCKDSRGNWCFNNLDTSKYGFANWQKVPPGTQRLAIRLPMTCPHGGTDGSVMGKAYDASGAPVALSQVYAWTLAPWGTAPSLKGWGIADKVSGNAYHVGALAAGQRYTIQATSTAGRTIRKLFVPVNACKATPLNLRF